MSVVSCSSGLISDLILNKTNISKATTRKSFQLVGHGGAVTGLLMLSFVGCDRTLAIVALCLGVGMNGFSSAGFMVSSLFVKPELKSTMFCSVSQQNHQDLSPNYSGTLSGITNTAGAITSFIPPIVTGALTKEASIHHL